MHDNPELSIIIVTWNSEDEIVGCLASIIDSIDGDLSFEIIVVDNNSSDKTPSMLRDFYEKNPDQSKIILNKENYGFTIACNMGIRSSSGENILFLNPDTEITGKALKDLKERLYENDKLGAIAPQLLNNDGSIQKSCRTFPDYFDIFCELSLLSLIFPKSKTFSRWKMNYFDHNSETIVEQPMAAALMVKRNILNEVNCFDERYKMFFNDVDLCRKIHDKGYEILFYPGAKIVHSKGVSIYKDRVRMINVWNRDCLSYFRKYNYNFFLYTWLSASLKLSGYFRILLYKLKK